MSEARNTEIFESILSYIAGEGIDINIQSQTSPVFQYLLMNEQKDDITLTSPIAVDDTVVNVSAGHGFTSTIAVPVPGEFMVVRNGNSLFQLRVVDVNTNAITVEAPIDSPYPVGGTSVIRGNVLMQINGSVTPVDFVYSFHGDNGANVPIDIQGVIFSFQSGATAPDDGTFGGLAELTNGLLLRKVNHENTGLGNYTSNQEFRDVGGTVEYTSKAPSGTYGTNIVIDIEGKFGQVIRLNPRDGDRVLARVRDDLTDLDKFTISILGSFTKGE